MYITRPRWPFSWLALLLVVCGCASQAPERTAAGGRALTDKDLTATVRGRTFEGRQSDRSYVRAYFAPNGKVSAIIDALDGRRYWSGGDWVVRGEALCLNWRNRDWTSGCASIVMNDNGSINIQPIQGGPSISAAKLLDGNPYSLGFN